MAEKRTVYTKPVLDALKGAHEHPEKRLVGAQQGVAEAIQGLGIVDGDTLNERGRTVTDALAAAGWKR